MLMDPFDPGGHRVGEGERNRRFDALCGAEFAHLQVREGVGAGPAAACGIQDPSHAVLRAAAAAGDGHGQGEVNNSEQAAKLDPIAKIWDDNWLYDTSTEELWGTIEQGALPAEIPGEPVRRGGRGSKVKDRLKRLWAIRIYRRWKTVGDISEQRRTMR